MSMQKKESSSLLCALRTSYCFLLASGTFAKLWDWSCFSKLVKQSTESTESQDILWCSVKIVSFIHKSGDRAIESSSITKEDALSCYSRLVLNL